jgi:hypothetical protein
VTRQAAQGTASKNMAWRGLALQEWQGVVSIGRARQDTAGKARRDGLRLEAARQCRHDKASNGHDWHGGASPR